MKTIGTKSQVLSALDLALNQHDTSPQRADEFTIADYVDGIKAKGSFISNRAARDRLDNLIQKGALKKRQLLIAGRQTNLYSKA